MTIGIYINNRISELSHVRVAPVTGSDPGGGGLRGLKPPPSKLMRCVTYIVVKILTLIKVKLQKNEHAKTPLHESAHEERQISIPETYRYQKQPIFHIKINKMPRKAFMRISDIDFLLIGTKSGLLILSYKQ